MGNVGWSGWARWCKVWWFVLLGCVLGACTSGGGETPYQSPGTGLLGSSCQKTEDCASGLCVRVDDSGGICTIPCAADTTCPAADNWACLGADESNLKLCACRKLADHEICADGIDNDCDGKVDDCRVCNGAQVDNDDPKNCGACGNTCDAKETCEDGACSCSKGTPTRCGSSCTDTGSDSLNCGACGTSCGSERACHAGQCECTDSSKPDFCEAGCVSLSSDANHCGKCDVVCKLAQVCSNGACACPSTDAPDFCDGVGCLSLQTDPKNCGKCGAVCGAGQVCSAGACACPSGKTLCGDTCVDTQTDRDHCGKCDSQCGTQQACSGGACGCQSFGFSVCGSLCANLQTDTGNCGACGKACGAGESCSAGACVCESALHCAGTCVPPSDIDNCGACGVTCGSTQYCNGASCTCQGFGLTKCGAACVDAGSDEANCGACGKVCPPTEQCNTGTCACPAFGQLFCAAQNACLDTLSDPQNCGACGKQCNPGEVCSSGVCKCSGGTQKYCATANTCVDTQSNTQDCGACDKKCEATQVCSFGNCQCPVYYQTFCASANACVDLSNNGANCGACGKQCPTATHCSGACLCDDSSQTLCGSSCKSLQSDPLNCGSCGNSCGANHVCSSGVCKCVAPTAGTALRLTTTAGDEQYLSAAWDGSHVGLVYMTGTPTTTWNIRFALLAPDGSLVSDVPLVTGVASPLFQPYYPKLTWTGSEYGVSYAVSSTSADTFTTYTDIVFRRVGADGQPIGNPIPIATHSSGNFYDSPAIAWSNSYGGYAISYAKAQSSLVFRRIGSNGTALENENAFTANYDTASNVPLAAAADGTWAIASMRFDSNVDLSWFNADGSKTSATQHLGISSWAQGGGPWLIHDGTTWITAWVSATSGINGQTLTFNRGTAANTPFMPFNKVNVTPSASLAMVNGTLAVGFGEGVGGSNGYQFRMQRFAIPSGTTSTMADLHPAIDISDAYTLKQYVYSDIQLVATGTGSMLGIWADTRWGNRELYARPIDLHSCP